MLDSATIPAGSTGVDQGVLSIGTAYDDLGRVQTVTSYPNADGTGTPVNQVQDAYDGWRNLVQEWQADNGAVDTDATPSVQYQYESPRPSGEGQGEGSQAVSYVRLTDVIYPNGRDVQYGYGDVELPTFAQAVDDIMSRLATITDSTGTLATYTYLARAPSPARPTPSRRSA